MLGAGLASAMSEGLDSMPPTATADEVSGKIWGEFCRARSNRLQYDYTWYVAERWYNNDMSVFYDAAAGRVYRTNSKRPAAKRTQPLALVSHAVDMLVAKQMRAKPVFDSMSLTMDQEDRLAARGARAVVRSVWDKSELTAERRPLFLSRAQKGNGFVKVAYDETGPPFEMQRVPCVSCSGQGSSVPPEAQQMYEEAAAQGINPPPPPTMPCIACDGKGQIEMGRRAMGDVKVTVVPPQEIWPCSGSLRVEEGCFHSFRMTREEAAARYHIPIDQVQSADVLEKGESDYAKMARQYRVDDRTEDKNHVWVVEKWLPPLPGRESPRVGILVGRKTVWPLESSPDFASGVTDEGVPPYGRIPIFHFRLRPVSESFWSNGVVLDMVAAADFVNRTRASFHRHQQTMAYTKWFTEEGNVDKDALTDEEGEVVIYRGSEPPQQRSPASMPQFYVNIFEMEKAHIPQLAGLQDIDQGKSPPGIEAFQALHFLAEQSETVHGPVYAEDERQWRAVALASLVCALDKYKPTMERMTRIGGRMSRLEMECLLKANVSDRVDISCTLGSALAHSPALRMEQVFRGLEVGILTPAEVKSRGLLDFGVVLGEDADDHRAQESVAVMENQAIARGEQHEMMRYTHDHEVHMAVHRRAALEAQLAGDVQLMAAYELACEEHAMAIAPPAVQPTQATQAAAGRAATLDASGAAGDAGLPGG